MTIAIIGTAFYSRETYIDDKTHRGGKEGILKVKPKGGEWRTGFAD